MIRKSFPTAETAVIAVIRNKPLDLPTIEGV